jgi:hypothetical protein
MTLLEGWAVLGFELRAFYAIRLEPYPQALFALIIFQIGSHTFAQVGLRQQASDLHLLCNWDNRHMPPSQLIC